VDTTDARSIFDGRLTYAKGASVAHMLRYLAPSDSIFFSGLRAFQRQYAYQTATTADFQVVMETAYGRSLDTFFRQWVYGEGFPTYTATWNQVGTNVFISLEQSTSVPSSVAAFNMPVTFRLTSATGDTLVKLPFSTANTLFRIPWGRTMNNLIIDPNNDILNRANPVFRDEALNIGRVRQDELLVYPNPSEKGWQLTGIAKGTSVQLLDAGGKVAWEAVQAPASLVIDSSSLAPGMYTLVVRRENGSIITRKLEKR
jgi:CubicO group peptidase (beta-lactamase class C family)